MKLQLEDPVGRFSLYGYKDIGKYARDLINYYEGNVDGKHKKKLEKGLIPLNFSVKIDLTIYILLQTGITEKGAMKTAKMLKGYKFQDTKEIVIDELEKDMFIVM